MSKQLICTIAVALAMAAGCAVDDGAPPGEQPVSEVRLELGGTFSAARCAAAAGPGEARCFARVRSDAMGKAVVSPAGATSPVPFSYTPADLRDAYAVPDGGAGVTVAIVDAFDNPTAEADLAVYRSQFGLPSCTTANGCFRKVNQRGAASPLPPAHSDWATEIALDIQMVSAGCPSCRIVLVEADTNSTPDLMASVGTAVAQGAQFVSNSYGSSERGITGTDAGNLNYPGVAIFASTGDYGFGAQYPATSAYVTAVGGTSLTRIDTSSSHYWSQVAWSGTGSGCSAVIGQPYWGARVTGCALRAESDVSAVADPATGVAVYDTGNGGWIAVGGTSASSPLVAAIYAASGNTGATPSLAYATPASFTDITSGSNGACSPAALCTAGAGWDGPTGLGTPNGSALASYRAGLTWLTTSAAAL